MSIDYQAALAASAEVALSEAEAFFTQSETQLHDIKPGQEKQILWAGKAAEKTEYVVVYVHGFSASLGETRPVPDRIAKGLGANLIFTRMTGHARPGEAMAEASAADWIADFAAAMTTARAIGQKVIVMACSNGAAITSVALQKPQIANGLFALVLLAPNFGLTSKAAYMATWPGFRIWGPRLAGKTRSWEAKNADHREFWTVTYPLVSVIPMMQLLKAMKGLDFSQMKIPAYFQYALADKVVDSHATDRVMSQWGGATYWDPPNLAPNDDPSAHVTTGDIISPSTTGRTVEKVLGWIKSLE